MIVSFCCPHLVVVSALRMLSVHLAFVSVVLMCSEKVSLGSRVSPRILGFLWVRSVWLLILRSRVVLYWAGSGVRRVVVVSVVVQEPPRSQPSRGRGDSCCHSTGSRYKLTHFPLPNPLGKARSKSDSSRQLNGGGGQQQQTITPTKKKSQN